MRFRERYGNGPTSWPLWVRIVVTVCVLWVPLNELLAVLTADGDPRAAGWLMVAGITGMFAWVVLRWLWQPTEASLTEEWHVQRALRRELETIEDGEEAPPLGIADREQPPSRW